MSKIKKLNASVYNKIAAGEVIERPASVVKELVENALDAGANAIDINIEGGGLIGITVTDNGEGIEKEDLETAFLPHATSKLQSAEQLESICSLGFRGEALASIASVSHVTLKSRYHSEDTGNMLTVKGGAVAEQSPCGLAKGTVVSVNNLFYNTPARLKFLKKPRSEESEITALVTKLILANSQIKFTYSNEGGVLLASEGNGLMSALEAVYGKELCANLLPVDNVRGQYIMHGYISNTDYSKANKTYQLTVLNGRIIDNATISAAIHNCYSAYLMKRRYPVTVIDIELPCGEVDVNVHPAKTDVRFRDESKIFGFVFSSLNKALIEADKAKTLRFSNTNEMLQSASEANIARINPSEMCQSRETSLDTCQAHKNVRQSQEHLTQDSTSDFSQQCSLDICKTQDTTSNLSELQAGGGKIQQVKEDISSRYQKPMSSSEMLQAAAADNAEYRVESARSGERFSYSDLFEGISGGSVKSVREGSSSIASRMEEFMKKTAEKEAVKTPLPKPFQTELNIADYTIVGQLFSTYIIIESGELCYIIDQHAAAERVLFERLYHECLAGEIAIQPMLVPYVFSVSASEHVILSDKLEELNSIGFDIEPFGYNTFKIGAVPLSLIELDFDRLIKELLSDTRRDITREKLIMTACKSAIKGNTTLSKEGIRLIFSGLFDKELPSSCPHGRPAYVKLTKTELEKMFKRRV